MTYSAAPVQAQPPAFQAKFALFAATKPGARYQYSGGLSIPTSAVPVLIHLLQTTPPDQRGNIELFMLGFNNTSRSGVPYVGGFVQPVQQQPQQQQPMAQQQQPMAQPVMQVPQPMAQPVMQVPQPMAQPVMQAPGTQQALQQATVPQPASVPTTLTPPVFDQQQGANPPF